MVSNLEKVSRFDRKTVRGVHRLFRGVHFDLGGTVILRWGVLFLRGCVQAQYPLNHHFHSHRTSTAPALQVLRFVVEALKNAALFRSGYNCKIDKWTLALEAGGFARYGCLLKNCMYSAYCLFVICFIVYPRNTYEESIYVPFISQGL